MQLLVLSQILATKSQDPFYLLICFFRLMTSLCKSSQLQNNFFLQVCGIQGDQHFESIFQGFKTGIPKLPKVYSSNASLGRTFWPPLHRCPPTATIEVSAESCPVLATATRLKNLFYPLTSIIHNKRWSLKQIVYFLL